MKTRNMVENLQVIENNGKSKRLGDIENVEYKKIVCGRKRLKRCVKEKEKDCILPYGSILLKNLDKNT